MSPSISRKIQPASDPHMLGPTLAARWIRKLITSGLTTRLALCWAGTSGLTFAELVKTKKRLFRGICGREFVIRSA